MSQFAKPKEENSNEVEMTQLKTTTRSRKRPDESGVELSNFQGRANQESHPAPRAQSPPSVLTADDQKSILVILIK
jgi:hypothetical protein